MVHPQSAYEAIKGNIKRRMLFRWLGVPWTVMDDSWQFIVSRLVIGELIGIAVLPEKTVLQRLGFGLLFGVIIGLSNVVHITGHTISGKIAGSPMDEALITPYSVFTIYTGDQSGIESRVHLLRALGGPLLNLLTGIVCLLIYIFLNRHPLIFFAAGINLFLGVSLMLPLRSADGEIIWRELRRS